MKMDNPRGNDMGDMDGMIRSYASEDANLLMLALLSFNLVYIIISFAITQQARKKAFTKEFMASFTTELQ
eukprot:CAMPEP_0116872184 /NCGR_PEP_ID=MMETSP0463-20121206/2876_1 /TAXON_ID=181622 /ORGANISM="Strombidinopsis sp, Strain SopsisLIS2011" /LENGTH=69 /DNA_ID=CAMNT_0004512035 /DNA_START=33 /DNA_END=242 /DNA_ORIENTATION=+